MMSAASSAWCGQPALRQPSLGSQQQRFVCYELPQKLQGERKSFSSNNITAAATNSNNSGGVEVLKVTKNGKLQSRRLAISTSRRSLLVTSNRIRSVKGFIRMALQRPQNREIPMKVIDVAAIDRIQRGAYSKRFLQARGMDSMNCLTIVYRISADSASTPVLEGIAGGAVLSSKATLARGVPHRFETLDLVISDAKDFEMLASVLEDLVEIYREGRSVYDRDVLLLEHYWIELGLDLSDKLSAALWISLCDKMNVPVKKATLINMYKSASNNHQLQLENGSVVHQDSDSNLAAVDCLSLKNVAELLEALRKASFEAMGLNDFDQDDPGTKLWNVIVATDPVPPTRESDEGTGSFVEMAVDKDEEEESISNVAMLSFVRSQQKEYRTSLEDVVNLCQVLNRQVMISDLDDGEHSSGTAFTEKLETSPIKMSPSRERLPKARFLSFLMSDANDLLDPTKGEQGTTDMTRPLSHYWINTVHDTYLAKFPISLNNGRTPKDAAEQSQNDTPDEQMYWAALFRGARCIELDVWDGTVLPVVARRQPPQNSDKNTIAFFQVLRIVRAYLHLRPHSYPIILNVENHCSLPFQRKMTQQLVDILGSCLFVPPIASNGKSALVNITPLPSPDALRGKVVVMGKRPKVVRKGATVVSDDFDEDNGVMLLDDDVLLNDLLEDDDEEDEGDEDVVVVGFDENGPMKRPAANVTKQSAEFLLEVANHNASEAHRDAKRIERQLGDLKTEANAAELLAAQLTEKAGLTAAEIRASAAAEMNPDDVAPGGVEVEIDSTNHQATRIRGIEGDRDQGLEVQDFFGDTVEGAKNRFSAIDGRALEAADKAAIALTRLNETNNAVCNAELALEASYQSEKDLAEEAQRAASDARTKREHADTARRRVETVRELLKNCVDSASSAETVVVTAYTEAKISEQRASEAEARASRALSTAEKDRTTADDESRKEELMEQEVERLHEEHVEAAKAARSARDRVEKAATMLDRVNEQIKLIEQSSQYQKELRELRPNHHDDDGSQSSRPRHGSKFMDKHAAKLMERKMCTELIKEATAENAAADHRRRRVQSAFEEKAKVWRLQAEKAASARKQAERSSLAAEELAEHAEEEREAATLRHIAREKAQANVDQSDSYRMSVEAQLSEAERASSEAASVAVESRNRAESLAREAERAKDHTQAKATVEQMKRKRDVAVREFEAAKAIEIELNNEAAEAKRLLDTSSEVFTSAQRDAAAEIHRANEDRAAKKSAVDAYTHAMQARKAVERAKEQFKVAKATLTATSAALRHAYHYKARADKVTEIDEGLARVTLLHTAKFKHWEKSLALPSAHVHKMAQGVVQQMVEKDFVQQREMLKAFTSNHLMRTFPSWHVTEHTPLANYDPIFQWSLGCQMVAMNLCSVDERVLVVDGRFRANGSSGYVLKPDYLIDDTQQQERQERWKFSILGGSCLPKPESTVGKRLLPVGGNVMHYVNPYVRVSLYDETASSGKVVYATTPCKRNGFNPIWNEKNDLDVAITNPSLAVLVFSVWDKPDNNNSNNNHGTDDFIAAAAVPVSCLREGFRSVALFDSTHSRCGPYAFASLLVKAQKLGA